MNLITQAQNMGIKIYLQNGQLKLDMPWPIESIPDPARYILRELKRRQAEVLAYLDPDQEQHWQAVLTNAHHLHYPKGNGKFEPLRQLHGILEQLKNQGARLTKMVTRINGGKIFKLELDRSCPELQEYQDQLNWLLALSVLGTVDYVDLAVDFPKEWIDSTLGKQAARITEFRAAIIEEIVRKGQRGIYFKVGSTGQKFCLVPGKTGRKLTEVTPEEYFLVVEAQADGILAKLGENALDRLRVHVKPIRLRSR